jgi:hypothetical protein
VVVIAAAQLPGVVAATPLEWTVRLLCSAARIPGATEEAQRPGEGTRHGPTATTPLKWVPSDREVRVVATRAPAVVAAGTAEAQRGVAAPAEALPTPRWPRTARKVPFVRATGWRKSPTTRRPFRRSRRLPTRAAVSSSSSPQPSWGWWLSYTAPREAEQRAGTGV